MKTQNCPRRYVASGLATFGLALAALSAMPLAHEGHKHKHDDSPAKKAASKQPALNADATLAALQDSGMALADDVHSGRFDSVHGRAESIESLIGQLRKTASQLAPEKRKRALGYLTNLSKLTDKLHHAADAKQADASHAALQKWQAQYALIAAQFGVKANAKANTKASAKADTQTGAKAEDTERATFAAGLAKAKPVHANAAAALVRQDSIAAYDALMSLHGLLHMLNPKTLSEADQSYWAQRDEAVMGALHPLGQDKRLASVKAAFTPVDKALREAFAHFGVAEKP
jgi:hypothetical protein